MVTSLITWFNGLNHTGKEFIVYASCLIVIFIVAAVVRLV